MKNRLPTAPQTGSKGKDHFQNIWKNCCQLKAQASGPIRVAVVHPVHANAIQAVAEAYAEGLITPILIGPKLRIQQAAKQAKTSIAPWQVIETEHSHAAAQTAVAMAAHGQVDAIMKGTLHTDELLGAIVPESSGLRTEHRISHAYIISLPAYHKPLIITDAAINIAPGLEDKADICRNSIALWHVLFGQQATPKVALLSAVETVASRMPSTIDAAALCKMAERGQITGAVLDGPLAFDNIISAKAAKEKGITSPVAGDADIIVVPNIESGNAIAKQMIYMGNADAAGIVLGARVPVILTSRADSVRTRLLSCAVAVAMAHARQHGHIK